MVMRMRTAVGLACSWLIIFILANSLPAPAPCSSRSPYSQLKSTTELLGTVISRRLLSVNETAGTNAAGSSSSGHVVPIVVSIVVVALVLVVAVFCWVRCRRTRQDTTVAIGLPLHFPANYYYEMMTPPNTNSTQAADTVPRQLTREGIEVATNNFSIVLGKGGFGIVYLGNLEGRKIAVKQLTQTHLNVSTKQFEREMGILLKVRHMNLVELRAYCNEGDNRFLCFEYLSGGSLDKLLYASGHEGSTETRGKLLDWGRRYYIIKEVRTGLHYLHSKEKILHMDLKASNILLDEDGKVVKIADFGISRLLDTDKSYAYINNDTTIIGMRAYLPDECFVAGKRKISEKADIYSYGMFVLEMVTGWRATDNDFPGVKTFQKKARKALKSGDVRMLLDRTLRVEDCNEQQVLACIRIASDCLNSDAQQRPDTMLIAQRLGS